MTRSKPATELPHWNICAKCAKKKGGKIPRYSCNTVTKGLCRYCKKKDQILIPILDFNWPDGRKAWLD